MKGAWANAMAAPGVMRWARHQSRWRALVIGAWIAAAVVAVVAVRLRSAAVATEARLAERQRDLEAFTTLAARYRALRRGTASAASAGAEARGASGDSLVAVLEAVAMGAIGRERIATMAPAFRPAAGSPGEAAEARLGSASLPEIVELLYGIEHEAAPLQVVRLELRERTAAAGSFDVIAEVARPQAR